MQHNNVPSTRRGTFFTQSTPTEFTAEQGATCRTHHFPTVVALIHFVTRPTVKGIAAITDANLVVGLKFVTPVTGIANVARAFVTTDLNFSAGCETVQTGIVIHHQCAIVIVAAVVPVPVYGCGCSNRSSSSRLCRRRYLFARTTRSGGTRAGGNSFVGVQVVMMMAMVMVFGCCCCRRCARATAGCSGTSTGSSGSILARMLPFRIRLHIHILLTRDFGSRSVSFAAGVADCGCSWR
jgi:hypothetical protein